MEIFEPSEQLNEMRVMDFCDRNEFLISAFPVIWQLLSLAATAKVVTVTLPIKEEAHRVRICRR